MVDGGPCRRFTLGAGVTVLRGPVGALVTRIGQIDGVRERPDELPENMDVVGSMGTHLYTRPWVEGDLQRLQKAEPSFSPDTLTSRFMAGNSRLPLAYIAALRRPESGGRAWLGHVALVDGDLIGMAECVWLPDSPQPAELAVLVADVWQRRGVGRLLVNGLLEQSEAAGVTRIEAVAGAANVGCYALSRSIDRGGRRPGGWSIRSWVTGGQRHFELRHQDERLRLPSAA